MRLFSLRAIDRGASFSERGLGKKGSINGLAEIGNHYWPINELLFGCPDILPCPLLYLLPWICMGVGLL